MNNIKFKTVEEMNMETAVELTAEEKVEAFKAWVDEKLDTCESVLSINVHNLDYALNQREPIRDELFKNKFEITYACINDFMKQAAWKSQADSISDKVLADAIAKFKKVKSNVRKTKAEYKQKFAELRESIAVAQKNEKYVDEIRNQVQDIITRWCSTYEIIAYCKADFEGEELLKSISYVTRWLLNSKLYPNEQEVKEFVEKYMANQTVTVAC